MHIIQDTGSEVYNLQVDIDRIERINTWKREAFGFWIRYSESKFQGCSFGFVFKAGYSIYLNPLLKYPIMLLN